ncbi:MAG: CAP domain-containing protein [Thermoleophilaceae bacterium]
MLAVAGLIVFAKPQAQQAAKTVADAPGCPGSGLFPAGVPVNRVDAAVVCLVNRQRRLHGVRPLEEQSALDAAAQAQAADVVRRRFWSHVNPDGKAPRARIEAAGYPHSPLIGENLAWGSRSEATPVRIVTGWLHSPEHRRVMLEPRFTEIGVGLALGAPQSGVADAAVYASTFGAGR